jgi:hypothetical protein
MHFSYFLILGLICSFFISTDSAHGAFDSTDSVITVKMNGPSTFYLDTPNQTIRASVEIENYSPSDGHYFMKVTHLPTNKILKDFEIYPKYAGNDIWSVQIAYPFLESDITFGDEVLLGEFQITIRTEFGSQVAYTKFSILETSPDHENESVNEQSSPPSKIGIQAKINKNSFVSDEEIKIAGTINALPYGDTISLRLINPNGNFILIDQVSIESERTFSYELDTAKNLFKESGEYVIELIYGNENNSKEILFFYEETSYIPPPEPIAEPAPDVVPAPEPTVEKPQPTPESIVNTTPQSIEDKENKIDPIPVSDEDSGGGAGGLVFLGIVFALIIILILVIKKRKRRVGATSKDSVSKQSKKPYDTTVLSKTENDYVKTQNIEYEKILQKNSEEKLKERSIEKATKITNSNLKKYVAKSLTRDFATNKMRTVDLDEPLEAKNKKEAEEKFKQKYPNLDNFHIFEIDTDFDKSATPEKNKEAISSYPDENNIEQPVTFVESTDYDKPKKPTFRRSYWDLEKYPIISAKRQKFLEAIEFCEKNNLGSKSKIRRLVKKLDKWKIENERDMEALLPDYEYLLEQIESFENQS